MRLQRLRRHVFAKRPLTRAAAEFLNAANGLHPLTRNPYASVLVFWFGWPTSEAPGLYATASALDAVRRGRRGDFAGSRGKAALALTAACWAILGVIRYRGSTTAGPVLEAGLTEQLGPDYAAELEALPTQPTRSGRRNLPLRTTVRTTMSRRRFVDKENIVSYGPHGRANLADIWRRRDLPRDGKAPVLLQVPGGAWVIGWRRPQAYPLMGQLVSRGWVCVSMNYRVSPLHTWPDHIVDVKRALAWVKENIEAYGGDPNFVAISGGSAGGHLSALAALTPNDPKFQPGFPRTPTRRWWRPSPFTVATTGTPPKTPGAPPDSSRLLQKTRGQAETSGTHRQIYLDASPLQHVRADAPQFFVLHGADDSLIPVVEAQEFVEELRSVSKSPVAYAELPHAQHGFDVFGSARADKAADAIARFLSWVYVTNPPTR